MPKCAFEGDKTSPNKENQRKFKYTMPLSGGPRILLHERGLQNKQGTTTITTTTTTTTRKVRHLSAKLLKNPQFWNTYIIVRSTLCRQCWVLPEWGGGGGEGTCPCIRHWQINFRLCFMFFLGVFLPLNGVVLAWNNGNSGDSRCCVWRLFNGSHISWTLSISECEFTMFLGCLVKCLMCSGSKPRVRKCPIKLWENISVLRRTR